MPHVTLPPLNTFRINLESSRWYVLNDPNPRLILALGTAAGLPKIKTGYWIYDPAKHRLEAITDDPQLAWEVDVEIRGI
jgi:hypothetical protein